MAIPEELLFCVVIQAILQCEPEENREHFPEGLNGVNR